VPGAAWESVLLTRAAGRPCVLAGQDRSVLPHGPQSLRTAQRGMDLAADRAAAGIVDHIVAERADGQLLAGLGRLLETELRSLAAREDGTRLAERQRRYRQLGLPHPD